MLTRRQILTGTAASLVVLALPAFMRPKPFDEDAFWRALGIELQPWQRRYLALLRQPGNTAILHYVDWGGRQSLRAIPHNQFWARP